MLGRFYYRSLDILSADPKPYFTFCNVTLAALALWLFTVCVSLWLIHHSEFPTATAESYRKICPLVQSPVFISSDLALAAFAFWMVRRYRERYYLACVYVYGMFFGNVLGLVNVWILCPRFFAKS